MTEQNKLVIVESPTKARKIGGYLGNGYTVMASVGHIRDLAQPSQVPAAKKAEFGKFGVDVNNGFEPYYVVGADKKKTVSDLKAALAKSGELFLATDEDREGEAIAWHLVQALKPKVPVKRMVFHEITKDAIQASLANTRNVDDHMVDAQETRRVLDRLYGYELSPVLWRKVGPGLSAGRVQSVATRLIVERERERMAFKKASYWDVCADLSANGVDFQARMTALNGERLAASKDFNSLGELQKTKGESALAHYLNEADACAIAQSLGAADFVVSSMDTKPYRRRPLPPFTTSTLQQTAGNRLSMSSRQTMRAAQSLYENGYITYMRTDSVTLSKEAIFAARDCVKSSFGDEYLADSPKQYATTSAGAQEAHECIRPAGSTFRNPADLAGVLPADQLKLYTLIWQRTLASQMADATGFTATVKLDALAGSFGTANFQASGTVIEFAGFMKVFGGFSEDEQSKALPPMANGDVLKALQVSADGHETQPPARYTEASLVKTLEAKEIGRPSTYASIISTIIDRGYVYERGRALIPSWLAFAVIKLLESNFPTYVDYAFTADMENGLDRIAHGEEAGKDWLYKFYFGDNGAVAGDFAMHEGLQKQVDQLGEIDAREINTIDIGGGLHVRVGRYGPYLEDTKNLDEEGNARRASIPSTLAPDELTEQVARDLIENNSDGPRVLGTDPQTGGSVEVRNGRFGAYVALVEASDEDGSQAADDSAKTGAKSSAKSKKSVKAKPKMASLFKTMDPATITLQDALRLLNLPRLVGVVEEVDEQGEVKRAKIEANNGRYGPYLTKTYERADAGDSASSGNSAVDDKPDNRSLASEDAIFSVTLDEAKELFAQPKYAKRTRGAAKPPLRELGEDPESGKPVVIKDGFYGAYITDGVTNRTLPKQYTPESIEPQVAFELLAQKRAAGPVKRKKTAAKKTSTKTSTKKTAAKKSTTKKATAKKSTSKSE
ncbi:type I DNA topoisomerase [Gardnerella vaginalis]|uniref:type I DNA topoisomerase n=1 Tax=Gardnerella vaginalis TaxID=2702 RepID=UPI0002635426|nr:type I DNA topoisomerase [Gardnerella vaginalis]EIK75673.1 DNA topoisomerase I [Gardnerella vaginalis 75712]